MTTATRATRIPIPAALVGVEEPRHRLNSDLETAAVNLTKDEVRFLVDYYYDLQNPRITAGHRIRAYAENYEIPRPDPEKPPSIPQILAFSAAAPEDQRLNHLVEWMFTTHVHFENVVKAAMDEWTERQQATRWMKSLTGIGPVISAGIVANVDHAGNNAGQLWSFAGLVIGQREKWTKGTKRPWNAALKRLAFLAGDCFVRSQNSSESSYGQLFRDYKAKIAARNDRGEYAERAKEILATKNFGDDTVAKAEYLKGRLPAGHVHMMAVRYIAKMFLSHVFEVLYWEENHVIPPRPYVIEHSEQTGGMHNEYFGVPHLGWFYPDFYEAKAAAGRLGLWEQRDGFGA